MIAIFLAGLLLISWQAFVDAPRTRKLAELEQTKQAEAIAKREEKAKQFIDKASPAEENPNLTHEQRLALSPRLAIRSDKLHGSLALKGARFDNLTLAKYRAELDPASPEVALFAPSGDEKTYFAQVGWIAVDGTTIAPDHHSIWRADRSELSPKEPVTLSWDNGQNIIYKIVVSMDEDYMFTLAQSVENKSGQAIKLAPYAFINRSYPRPKNHYGVLHEGPMGVMDGTLTEISYDELRDKTSKKFENASGWLGITDKYWLSALIPGESDYQTNFSYYTKDGIDRFQVDYLGRSYDMQPGQSSQQTLRLFAGAKEIQVLDRYTAGDAKQQIPPIPLFDRAVDFGILYFMTKPMFLTLNFFYALIGNFGVAIMMLTILVKLLMYPLANKSYHSMAQMRALQPEMAKLRERYADDSMAMNKEMMALYKREKVNPAAGCLPVLIQMPVFFALYKVLYVTIEMRHAPFFGWLKDLSVTDPSNIFTLFGLIPWNHPAWMHIGVLPILFCITMIIQMKQQPKPTDPVQAKMMAIMPYFFLYLFASFPAGLVVYWVWSNVLSIIQQHIITKRHEAKKNRKAAA
jgi:YidC/Oxa1 family membrane protein insertase